VTARLTIYMVHTALTCPVMILHKDIHKLQRGDLNLSLSDMHHLLDWLG